ncbi:hypothetical protein J1N35_019062 [Gossypium stocksii]|uniref:Uncharacterized protein n=1 Tax=Gossypium stocksii TaxID=47602 RepID=A0A9D3VS68_9ROSI|nr:hypothetical protein J1N35_019062 [Gossypium stocksii]
MLRYQWEDTDHERVGTSSRQKQKFTHTVGSRSFACVAEAKEVLSGQKVGRLQLFDVTHKKKDGSPMTSEAREIMEKLKEKKAEYEAVASTDSSVNHEDIDKELLLKFWVLKVQRLKDQIAQIQASTVEQIAKVQRKYEELQQQLIVDAAEREAVAVAREAKAAAMAAEQSRKHYSLDEHPVESPLEHSCHIVLCDLACVVNTNAALHQRPDMALLNSLIYGYPELLLHGYL